MEEKSKSKIDNSVIDNSVIDNSVLSDEVIEDHITEHMILIDTKQHICRKISIIIVNQTVNQYLTDDRKQAPHEHIFIDLYDSIQKEKAFKYIDESYARFILSKQIGEWLSYMIKSDKWRKSKITHE